MMHKINNVEGNKQNKETEPNRNITGDKVVHRNRNSTKGTCAKDQWVKRNKGEKEERDC